jgi:hypothetical protein
MTRLAVVVSVMLIGAVADARDEAQAIVNVHNSDIAAVKLVFRRGRKPTMEIWFTASMRAELARVMSAKRDFGVAFIDVLTNGGFKPLRQTPAMFEDEINDLESALKFAQDLSSRKKVKLPK